MEVEIRLVSVYEQLIRRRFYFYLERQNVQIIRVNVCELKRGWRFSIDQTKYLRERYLNSFFFNDVRQCLNECFIFGVRERKTRLASRI